MSNSLSAVVATQRITCGCAKDGTSRTIEPSEIFVPDSTKDLAFFKSHDAVREPTEAEAALFEQMTQNSAKAEKKAAKPAAGNGGGRGRGGKPKVETDNGGGDNGGGDNGGGEGGTENGGGEGGTENGGGEGGTENGGTENGGGEGGTENGDNDGAAAAIG